MVQDKKLRVLVVEDDKFILKAIRYKFEEANFEVKTTLTAEEGLEILKDWTPDMIVLDVLLPGIDGYAFLREVKNNLKWCKIPVVISSNLDEQIGADPRANAYIVKSDLDLDELVLKIRKLAK